MKICANKLEGAVKSLNSLTIRGPVKYKTARALNRLKKALSDELLQLAQDQDDLIKNYNGVVLDNGKIKLESPEKRIEFENAWKDMIETWLEIDASMVDLSEYADTIEFKSSDIDFDALAKVVKIE